MEFKIKSILLLFNAFLLIETSVDLYFEYKKSKIEEANQKYHLMLEYKHDFGLGYYFKDDEIYEDFMYRPQRQYICVDGLKLNDKGF